MLIRVAGAFRTAFTAALQVAASVLPIDLLVLERRYTYKNRRLNAQQMRSMRNGERGGRKHVGLRSGQNRLP